MQQLTREPIVRDGPGPPAAVPQRPRRARVAAIVVAVALLVIGAAVAYALRPKAAAPFVTAPVERKTLVASVTATGVVNPQETISVGTQVSGTIQALYADFNDRVRTGEVLARLDPTLFRAALAQARGARAQAAAQWAAARANARVALVAIASADANVAKTRAALVLAQRTVERDAMLVTDGFLAASQYDVDEANRVAAEAALQSAFAADLQARMQEIGARGSLDAGNAQAAASLELAGAAAQTGSGLRAAIDAADAQAAQAQTNLAHTVIVSPVDGTVIARNVSVGQTVAASFQTPTLFTIAKDLTKMEVDLAVGEPDVGAVRVGQSVTFSVLAYPNAAFVGRVAQVRQNPTTVQNVVTYTTVVYENNADGRLRPGMTANASIETARLANVLTVPRAALAFRMPATRTRPAPSGAPRAAAPSDWGNVGNASDTTIAPGHAAHLTVVENGKPRDVAVRVRLVSGGDVAIDPLGSRLAPGTAVATAVDRRASQPVSRSPAMTR